MIGKASNGVIYGLIAVALVNIGFYYGMVLPQTVKADNLFKEIEARRAEAMAFKSTAPSSFAETKADIEKFKDMLPRKTEMTKIQDLPYHVTQRGNRREDIFFADEDRKRYLEWLKAYSEKYGLKILAYCLMTNHVHLVAVPRNKDSLEKVMRPLHTRYAMYINRSRNWSGHLWQWRYFSSALDEKYLWMAVCYVELNPVRAGIVHNDEDYLWSSATAHCRKRKDTILSSDFPPAGGS